MAKQVRRTSKTTVVLNFRVSQDIFRELEKYGQELVDDTGQKLSAAMAARRLVNEALKKIGQGI